MDTLRRGFKAEANEIAREIRRELGLQDADPLDVWQLAEHLAIPVVPLRELSHEVPGAVHHFHSVDRQAFSAATVFLGPARLIVYNDSHDRGRQASDIAHELAHALLEHPPKPALDPRGCRDWNREEEDEATWLAGALLISEEAALYIARKGMPLGEVAEHFRVTRKMVQFRLNVTGANKRVQWARR